MGAGFENLWTISSVAGAIIVVLAVVLLLLRARGSLNGRRNGRLGILDYYEVDKNRRLVIVRRDDVEHLLLIGGPQDLLIEKGLNMADEAAGHDRQRTYRGDISEDLAALRPAPAPKRAPERAPPQLRTVVSRTEPRLNEKDKKSGDAPDDETPNEPTLR